MINIALRREWHKLQFYTEGTVPDALAGVPVTWNINQISEFQDYFDSLLEHDTGQRRKVRFVPETIAKAFVQTKEGALKDEFDEWIARFVCYAFSVSSQWAVKMMNRSTAESAAQQAQEEGLAPLQSWVRRVMNRIIAQVFKRPDLQFRWKEDQAVSPQEQAAIDDTNLKNGSATINEVRANRGQEKVEDGDTPMIYTATGAVPLKDVLNPPPPPAPLNQLGHNGGPALDDDNQVDKPPAPAAKGGKVMKKAAGDEQMADDVDELGELWLTYFEHQADQVTGYLADQAGGDDDLVPAGWSADTMAIGAIEASATAAERSALSAATTELLQKSGIAGVDAGLDALAKRMETGGAHAGIVLGPKERVEITNLAHPDAVEYAQTRGAALVSKIDDTTRGLLRNLIATAQTEGWSVAKLADQVESMGGFGPVRAGMIAKNELAASSIRGNLASWKRADERYGIKTKKRVILGINEDHCPACLQAVRDGAIDLDDSWDAGEAPPFHPRCGCDLVPVVQRDTDEADDMAKAGGNPHHDARGRFTSAPAPAGHDDPAQEHSAGLAAMAKVIATHQDHDAAMHVAGVGPVSFVWGEEGDKANSFKGGYGLAKIVAKHGSESALAVPHTLAYGSSQRGPTRVVVEHQEHRVVLTKGGKGPDTHWVLTAYQKGKGGSR